jgi:hypothetical protein
MVRVYGLPEFGSSQMISKSYMPSMLSLQCAYNSRGLDATKHAEINDRQALYPYNVNSGSFIHLVQNAPLGLLFIAQDSRLQRQLRKCSSASSLGQSAGIDHGYTFNDLNED